MDSSRTEVCSGVEPCFEGSCARGSFSTYEIVSLRNRKRQVEQEAYGDLEVDKLFSECGHLIVEAESEFANVVCCEDKVALSLLFAL